MNDKSKELQQKFQEGALIARAHRMELKASQDKEGIVFPVMDEIDQEMTYLDKKRSTEGLHQNVERHGQRNRSATLLVPGVDMELFTKVGFLYDADKSTIRAYMFKDSRTSSQRQHDNFYNVEEDKKKFEPILSREEFIKKYKEFRKVTDGTVYEKAKYNEILGNFFTESLIGLVAADDTLETKVSLLMLRHHMKETHGIDLPMVLMNKGKIQVWEPTKSEIVEIINNLPSVADNVLSANKGKLKDVPYEDKDFSMQVYVNAARCIGYDVTPSRFDKFVITEADVKDVGKNPKDLFIAQDITEAIHKATGLQRGGTFTHGLEGRLLDITNARRKEEGKKPIADVKKGVFLEEDVKGLISILCREQKIVSKHKDEISNLILEQVKVVKENRLAPPDKQKQVQGIGDDKISKSRFDRLEEFGYKIGQTLGIKNKHVKKQAAELWKDEVGEDKKDIKPIQKPVKKAEEKWSKKVEKSESSDKSI